GVFLKSGDALERIANSDHIVFDKTGTLTLGQPRLISTDVQVGTLEHAARLARASRHPLSRALVDAVGPGTLAEDVREHAGLGLEGVIDGQPARLGSAEWVGVETSAPSTTLWYSEGDQPPVRLDFEDELRGRASEAIAALKARGFTLEIVSGDRPAAVEAVADALGIETWQSGVKPAGKAERLEALGADGKKALMIGDGLNDAGALSLAHAALAPGGAMDVSQSASDAVYRGGDLMAVVDTVDAARRARSAMLQNFTLAALYNVIAVPIAVAGFATPLVAAIAMSASSLIVTLNALRQNY
ncbi:MAG: HAD-IC family P-type ATPase, partial [Pseudomonadota bacterium]